MDPDPTDDPDPDPDPADPGRVVGQESEPEPDPRDTIRAPSPDDPKVDENSTVDDLIKYGRHGLTQDGLATRIGYLWRRRALEALYLLRQKPKSGRRKGDFGDLAESLGYSRSQGYKLAHLWPIIDQVDAWAAIKAEQSKRRRMGIEEWPADEAILKEFPSPLTKTPRAGEEKDEEKREEDEARERARGGRNSDDDDEDDDDELRARIAKLEADLELTERALKRERELTELLNKRIEQTPATPVAPAQAPQPDPARVVGHDSCGSRRGDLFASMLAAPDPDPVVDPVVDGDADPVVDAVVDPLADPPVVDPVDPDPSTIAVTDKILPDQRDEIEKEYGLATGFGGVVGKNDVAYRNRRANFYFAYGERLTPQQADALKRRKTAPKTLWEADTTVGAVLVRLDALMKADATVPGAETVPDVVVVDPVVDAPDADAPDMPDVPDVAA